LWPGEGQVVITKGPYLQAATQTSMVVMWETNLAADAKVLYGETSALGREAASRVRQRPFDHAQGRPELVEGRLHSVNVTGLAPGSRYYYKVVCGAVQSEIYAFKTAPPPDAQRITFVAYGDNRGGIQKHRLIAGQIRRLDPDFIIHTGDMVFNGRLNEHWATQFFDPLKDVISRSPIFPIMGNHEALSDLYYDYFCPLNGHGARSKAYYSFDYGPAHFAAVNVYEDYRPGSAQHKWLRDDLARAKGAQWRFVYLHFSPFTSGERCFDIETVETRAYLQRVFEEAKVDIVFGGHDHIYERTLPIRGNQRDDTKGVTYIVAAGGGAALYGVDPQWWSAYAESRNNFCVVTLQGKSLSLEARGLDGEVFDELRISKDGQAIDELKAQLSGAKTQDKVSIASELGEFVDVRVVEPLLALLDDPDISVRRAAAHSLAINGQPAAVNRILEIVCQETDAGATPAPLLEDVEIRQSLAEALTRSRTPAAIRGLVKLADSQDELTRLIAMGGIRWVANESAPNDIGLRHINPTLKRYALAALRKIAQVVEDNTAEGALKDAKRRERLKAVRALQEDRDPSAVGPLLDLLRADWQDTELKGEIFKALARIDPQRGALLKTIVMVEAMKSGDYQVRCAIIDQLDTIDRRRGLLALIQALDDQKAEVRNAAIVALRRISGQQSLGGDKAKWQAWYDQWRKSQRAPGPR
jgi:HEAT repeat protein